MVFISLDSTSVGMMYLVLVSGLMAARTSPGNDDELDNRERELSQDKVLSCFWGRGVVLYHLKVVYVCD